MKNFLDENFLLQNKTAESLFHEHSEKLPIIDYHCHLSPKDIADDRQFDNLTQIWLEGDHYKWRAMRANGVPEKYITGDASDNEKFLKWAETVPYTLRNPLYHWTHLELLHPFGIHKILNPATAQEIYDECTQMLRTKEFSVRGIMKKMNVELVCTTDDPIDNLQYHQKIKKDNFSVRVLPAWRPDKSMAVESPENFNAYVDKLAQAADVDIRDFKSLISALEKRHDFFHQEGCRLSDHGLDTFLAEDYTDNEIEQVFKKVRGGKQLDLLEISKFKSAMLYQFAYMDHKKGWTQQFHVGAIRNNNTRMFKQLGPDTGYDAINDPSFAASMVKFFDKLSLTGQLTKTMVYNLNPKDNELMVTIIGSFNDGTIPGKMQYGSGWWFLDQKDGMQKQMTALSNLGLLSRFVGMTTDSRSFLSYTRHEYFRRILCNLIGTDVENGEIPNDMALIGKMAEDISYYNAKNYFQF
ncbi:MAG: glucuronate isomerase [Bacteroidota bacterium]|nr:glucuronate isomerase [Bacteroidota bacterium]MDP4226081.1 glucuronate isomerase [Bacteroidota bacterium]